MRPGVVVGDGSGGSRGRWSGRRDASGCGDVECVAGAILLFLGWRRVAAGTSSDGGELQLIGASMILWTKWARNGYEDVR
jgi:hypothetical protein